MRLACQESLVPGSDLLEKWRVLEHAGWNGIELLGAGGGSFRARERELQAAHAAGVPLRTVCVQGGPFIGDLSGERRRVAVAGMKELLDGIAAVGGRGAITPASYGVHTAALPPYRPPRAPEEDREVLLEALGELGEHAARAGVLVLLEPLNRYEDYMVNRLDEAVALAEATGQSSVRVMGDLYHMNIEEPDPLRALERAAPRLAHVHLSDSNRGEPFAGHVDWAGVLAALERVGYDGDLVLECELQGPPRDVFPAVARRLRALAPAAG